MAATRRGNPADRSSRPSSWEVRTSLGSGSAYSPTSSAPARGYPNPGRRFAAYGADPIVGPTAPTPPLACVRPASFPLPPSAPSLLLRARSSACCSPPHAATPSDDARTAARTMAIFLLMLAPRPCPNRNLPTSAEPRSAGSAPPCVGGAERNGTRRYLVPSRAPRHARPSGVGIAGNRELMGRVAGRGPPRRAPGLSTRTSSTRSARPRSTLGLGPCPVGSSVPKRTPFLLARSSDANPRPAAREQ